MSENMVERVADEWQPIETAPREWVLLWTGEGAWRLGFYMLSEERWHIEGDGDFTPTYWHPLPAPPLSSPNALPD